MSMCRVFSCVVGRGCFLWPVRTLGKTLLAFALLSFVLQDQSCLLLQVSLDFLLCIPIPYDEKNIFFFFSFLFFFFFLVLVIEGLGGHHRTIQLQLIQHQWLGHSLEILWLLNPWWQYAYKVIIVINPWWQYAYKVIIVINPWWQYVYKVILVINPWWQYAYKVIIVINPWWQYAYKVILVIQDYVPSTDAEEAEVEWCYDDLQDLLRPTPKKKRKEKKNVLFIIGYWNAKVGSQETAGVTGRFGLGVQKKAGQRLTEFC